MADSRNLPKMAGLQCGNYGLSWTTIDYHRLSRTGIFISDFACLQAINLTNSTTGDLVFMGGTKFYPVYAESSRWNTLMHIHPVFMAVPVGRSITAMEGR